MKRFILKNKKELLILITAVCLTAAAIFVPVADEWLRTALFLPAYLLAAFPVIKKALRNIAHGDVFDENFLMLVASVGALCIHENTEAIAVMIFYRVGEMFEHYAVECSRADIAAIMDIRPETARVLRDGADIEIDPEDVEIGETVIILPGERIPLDGIIESGVSSVDASAMTGESVPVDVAQGDTVMSGCVNLSGPLRVKTTKEYDDNTVVRILELIENSASEKAETESFITKFAKVYTPVVCAAALCVAVIPPLFVGGWAEWIHRALTSLVVSCPCALVISVPLGFFCGIGGASKKGILIKGGNCMETLADVSAAVFDKTGTLTKGTFEVSQVFAADGVDEKYVVSLAAEAERYSLHPIAEALKRAADGVFADCGDGKVEEIAGMGVRYTAQSAIAAGNLKLMSHENVKVPDEAVNALKNAAGTHVFVAENGKYMGCVIVSDVTKPESAPTVAALSADGIKTVMLTGDGDAAARAVAQKVGIGEVKSSLLPEDKANAVRKLKSDGEKVVFVGDGMNDAPVLMLADVGIAMGGIGSDAAVEASDIVIMKDDISKVPEAIRICRRTLRIVRQNIVFALVVKAAVLLLGFTGLCGMWAAVFADVGVSVIAIMNSMRAS